jgi:hypothetical protein
MPSTINVETGQRYRDVHQGLFGITRTEWIVESLFRGTDGLTYARIVCASDHTQRKSLSVDVLTDRSRFEQA